MKRLDEIEFSNRPAKNRNVFIAEKSIRDIAKKCKNTDPAIMFEDICNVVGTINAQMLFDAKDNKEIAYVIFITLMFHLESAAQSIGLDLEGDNGAMQ